MPDLIQKAHQLEKKLDVLINKLKTYEKLYKKELEAVHPHYRKSARNLIHYLAIKTFDLTKLHSECRELGITGFKDIQVHVAKSLFVNKNVLRSMQDKKPKPIPKSAISRKRSRKLLNRHTTLLFGYKSRKRRTRIMVTMPNNASTDYRFVKKLVDAGMNSARINCASDGPETWLNIITNIRKANRRSKKNCRIMMDLSGPKLRTGSIVAGPEVVHVKPKRNLLGQVIEPAKLWLGKAERIPLLNDSFKVLPIDTEDLKKLKRGDTLRFKDSRGKSCKIKVGERHKKGFWAYCSDSAYITSGKIMLLKRKDKTKNKNVSVGSLQAVERSIILKAGDELILHKFASEGESPSYDTQGNLIRKAHISCTLPSVLEDVKIGESVFFDDGKIGGEIIDVKVDSVLIRVNHAKEQGTKLRANKGINFPDSKISLKGLTEKDIEDLQFVCFQADVVSLSFVNDANDVQDLLDTLKEYKSDIGLILKIETKRGLKNISSIILRAMQTYPIGILIARGDLAVEAGWKNIGFAQEDIRRICKAAHIPSIWATQVLESYAKKGMPSRAELTDAIRARKSECIMLNKGPYILKTIDLLDKLLQGKKSVDSSFPKFKETQPTIPPKETFLDQIKVAGYDDDQNKWKSESIEH